MPLLTAAPAEGASPCARHGAKRAAGMTSLSHHGSGVGVTMHRLQRGKRRQREARGWIHRLAASRPGWSQKLNPRALTPDTGPLTSLGAASLPPPPSSHLWGEEGAGHTDHPALRTHTDQPGVARQRSRNLLFPHMWKKKMGSRPNHTEQVRGLRDRGLGGG